MFYVLFMCRELWVRDISMRDLERNILEGDCERLFIEVDLRNVAL